MNSLLKEGILVPVGHFLSESISALSIQGGEAAWVGKTPFLFEC